MNVHPYSYVMAGEAGQYGDFGKHFAGHDYTLQREQSLSHPWLQ